MSVNLNILANKAIRGYADVDDISTATDVYTSGSSYILYAINNDANIPVTGLPQQNEYCSQSILWVSQTSSFSSSLTQSFIGCNSSSLSGSYLYYGSFTDNEQPGGFLEDNNAYLYRVFDRTIDYDAINSGVGKSYYFKNYKIADFGYIGDFSNTDSTNLMLPNTAATTTLNANRWLYFWEAKGYDNSTNTLWRNYPPTFVSGTNPGLAGGAWPAPFDASSSIADGGITGATPEIVMYGNGGSPALKTNGATLTLPMASSLVQNNFVLTLCIIQGEVTMSTTPVDGNSLTLQASAENNKISLLGTGAPFNSSTLNNTTVRNAIISVKSRVTTVSPTANGFTQLFVANLAGQANGSEAQWQSAGNPIPPNAASTQFNLGSPWTLTTSADCIIRFVTTAPNTLNDLGGLATAYYATNGLYTGSLNA